MKTRNCLLCNYRKIYGRFIPISYKFLIIKYTDILHFISHNYRKMYG